MNLRRYLSTASVVVSLAFGFTGSAFADTISIDKTGANSTQKVVIDNTSEVTVTNVNHVQATTVNVQEATSGDVAANKNTSISGKIGSGGASNSNAAVTTVAVSNGSGAVLPVGGSGNGTGNGNGNGNGTGATVGGLGSATPAGGNVLGAATTGGFGGGAAVLPSVGASVPVDVSALRAAWNTQTAAPTATLAKSSQMFTGLMLLTATLLSLLGAIGSAMYAKRREERV